MSRLTAMLAALALGAAVPAGAFAETTWSGTGPNGGTVQGSGSCSAGQGAVTCDHAGTWTGPKGAVATRQGQRVTTREGTTKSITTTGPFGRVTETTRTRKR